MTLAEIQAAVKAPKTKQAVLPKGRYDYRSLEDIVRAAKQVLAPAGLALIMEDAVEQVGARVYIKASARIVDGEGKTIAQASAYAREPETMATMSAPQITGSASSYARKYALGGLLALDNSLPDADELHAAPEPPVNPQALAAQEGRPGLRDAVRVQLTKDGIDPDRFAFYFDMCNFSELRAAMLEALADPARYKNAVAKFKAHQQRAE